MSRPLRSSERRLALLFGDAAAALVAVLLALWTWSITAGFPYDLAFLRARVVWLLAGAVLAPDPGGRLGPGATDCARPP